MKFITSSSALLKKLSMLGNVIVSNSTNPIMENFLFELEPNLLKITASDGETTMVSSLEVESEDSGKITVPSRLILDLFKTFGEQPITLKLVENKFEVVDEKDTFEISVESAEDYPQLPIVEPVSTVAIKGNVLAEAINNTLFATGNDAMRPIMSGVLFQFSSKGCNFVATDAHRLVKYTRTDVKTDSDTQFIMPKKSLQLIKNNLANIEEDVVLNFNEANAQFTFEDSTLICRLVEGKYPNYDAVIPKDNPNVLTINTSMFLNSVRKAALFTSKSTNQMKFSFNGNQLKIDAEDADYSNKADITLPCDYNGSEMVIGFNSKFLLEMLSNLHSDDLTLEMSVPSKAGILKPVDGLEEEEDLLMLVMPVMVS